MFEKASSNRPKCSELVAVEVGTAGSRSRKKSRFTIRIHGGDDPADFHTSDWAAPADDGGAGTAPSLIQEKVHEKRDHVHLLDSHCSIGR